MKKLKRTNYQFEEQDKYRFNLFLIKNRIKAVEFAEKIGISLTYLSYIINGKRVVNEELKRKFEEQGFKL